MTEHNQDNSIKHRLARWIPGHVSVKVIVAVYHLLDRFCFIGRKTRENHKTANLNVLRSEESPYKGEYIDNQYAWKNVEFGKTTMAVAGCEVMSVYNVMRALGMGEGPELICRLIENFEKSGASLMGKIGSSPLGIRRCLKKNGIKTRLLWKTDCLPKDCNMAIVTMYNDKSDLYRQIHTIAFIKDEEKGIVAHNTRTAKPGYPTMKEAVEAVGTNPGIICILEIL